MADQHVPPGPPKRPEDLNPNTDQFWKSRGYPARPPDWQTRDPKSPPPGGDSPKK